MRTRLAFSATPLVDSIIDALDNLDQHANPIVDDSDAWSVQTHLIPTQQITTSPADLHISQLTSGQQTTPAHVLTGLDQARQQFGLTGIGQTVAIIDTGIAYDHIALGGGFGPNYRVVGGYDFAENDANPYDDAPAGFHGTGVAGVVGGTATGVAPALILLPYASLTILGRVRYSPSNLRCVGFITTTKTSRIQSRL